MMAAAHTHPDQVFTHCPRCGASPFQPQSGRFFRCAACGFVYYINAAAAVVALITDDSGALLLTRRAHEPAKGMLDLPGGFVDIGETGEEALRREIREELDLAIDSFTYFGSFPNTYEFAGLTYFTLDLAFRCRIADLGRLQISDEIIDTVFVPPPDIDLAEIGLASIREIIHTYRSTESSHHPV